MEEETDQNKKKWIFIILGVLILILLGLGAFLFFNRDSSVAKSIAGVLPFGQVAPEELRDPITGGDTIRGNNDVIPGTNNQDGEPMFRQLTTEPVAGTTRVIHNGKTFIRYVLRENGFVYDVDPATGDTRQLTNKTIERVYEALFGNGGNTIVFRYLTYDAVARRDIITTFIGNLELPVDGVSIGTVVKDSDTILPDDIPAVSISPDGSLLFYLRLVPDGVSGTVVHLTDTVFPKEVLRNSFSEWLPQIFNDGTILLTTKPSAAIPGYAYLYYPANKSLSRILREKNGLTTFSDNTGDHILFSENIPGGASFGMYNKTSYDSEEGVTNHEALIPLTTLPEKCAWGELRHTLYCGAYTSNSRAQIPDEWYQGLLNFNDSFWRVNTDTTEITFLADPQKVIQKNFDVTMPLVDKDELFFVFVDKNDDSLWAMRIPALTQDDILNAPNQPELTPEEIKDAVGSVTQ